MYKPGSEVEVQLIKVTDLPACVPDTLIQASLGEGLDFVARTLDEWVEGKNRFDRPGEIMVGAFIADRLVGLCGLSDDPYTEAPEVGRIRHFYVLPEIRRHGVGRKLMGRVLTGADSRYTRIRLRALNEQVGKFYETFGFRRTHSESDCTHIMDFQSTV